ncbi:hypothetical protein ACSYDW_17680 [Paeniglutamicibacter sp. R2-26]|uniref:hypothetical protein n=1 Tax=Paeniglutamicibacter sp. R2-26 TaxID=3144417 RepID=UPI003EE458EE
MVVRKPAVFRRVAEEFCVDAKYHIDPFEYFCLERSSDSRIKPWFDASMCFAPAETENNGLTKKMWSQKSVSGQLLYGSQARVFDEKLVALSVFYNADFEK